MKAYKTFYYEFANNDYRDNPVLHGLSNPEKISVMEELVLLTKYEFGLN